MKVGGTKKTYVLQPVDGSGQEHGLAQLIPLPCRALAGAGALDGGQPHLPQCALSLVNRPGIPGGSTL